MELVDLSSIETVKTAIEGAIGIITLNRPKALNALDQPMCLAIDATLKAWAKDDRVAAVIIRGAGDRAFCAGGDVRAVREDGIAWKRGKSDGSMIRDFFRDEYRMNRRIRTFPKPYLALIDGITMGGGVGLSVHGTYRVATERTLLAMPETAIGLFPDVGASYVLPRLTGEVGIYLALTGGRLKAADALALGIATHAVPSGRLNELVAELVASIGQAEARAVIDRVLGCYMADAGRRELVDQRSIIDRCFGFDKVEDILAALDSDRGDFAAVTAAAIRTMSPTSLKLTLKQMRLGRTLDFDACLRMEYRLTQSVLAGHDFYEGVRTVLVDKDHAPKWYPGTLDAVDDSAVENHFRVPLQGDLSFPD
ncbi:MAG: enoyl-CoA hydratase [Rhodospirillales bacterium]|nr:enoyl-CoA hydratase [Rhodospirillales bacterium]